MTNQTAAATSSITSTARLPREATPTGRRDRISAAFTLITIGVGSLALRFAQPTPNLGAWVVLAIGLAFVAAFAFTRRYDLLVPAGIVTGLGAGIVVSQSTALADLEMGGVIVLGLGLGFLSIWLVGAVARVAEHHWWPLLPGGILATIGVALLAGGQAIDVLDYWPVALIGLGMVVLGRAWTQSRTQA
jgi:hypothetical protein